MNNPEREIELRLVKVQETGFYMNSSLLEKNDELKLNNLSIKFGINLIPDLSQNKLDLKVIVRYLLDDNEEKKVLELETSNIFEILNIKDIVTIREDMIIDTSGITPTLVGVAIGTLRGILFTKTVGTALSEYPLPIINPVLLCNALLKEK